MVNEYHLSKDILLNSMLFSLGKENSVHKNFFQSLLLKKMVQ